jgi:hypothetical protein
MASLHLSEYGCAAGKDVDPKVIQIKDDEIGYVYVRADKPILVL